MDFKHMTVYNKLKAKQNRGKCMSKSGKTKKVIAGIILIAIVLLIVIHAPFFSEHGIEWYDQASEGDTKVACVGDSVTYGERIIHRKYNCYPAQLGRMLGNGWHVKNFGVSGSTVSDESRSSYRRTKEYKESLGYEPDIVILMLGTNDTKSQNWKSKEFFQEQYEELLESYLSLEKQPEIYVCTPASAYFPKDQNKGRYAYGIRAELLEDEIFVIQDIAQQFDLQVIDIHGLTSEHRSWFQQDGVHPLRKGARAIAEAVKDVLETNTKMKEEI